MSPNDALTIVSVAAVIGTGVNVYLTLRISNAELRIKDWARETFIAKDSLWRYVRDIRLGR